MLKISLKYQKLVSLECQSEPVKDDVLLQTRLRQAQADIKIM